jgi:hypothetical protein
MLARQEAIWRLSKDGGSRADEIARALKYVRTLEPLFETIKVSDP